METMSLLKKVMEFHGSFLRTVKRNENHSPSQSEAKMVN